MSDFESVGAENITHKIKMNNNNKKAFKVDNQNPIRTKTKPNKATVALSYKTFKEDK